VDDWLRIVNGTQGRPPFFEELLRDDVATLLVGLGDERGCGNSVPPMATPRI
jgi:hypothetical protein